MWLHTDGAAIFLFLFNFLSHIYLIFITIKQFTRTKIIISASIFLYYYRFYLV